MTQSKLTASPDVSAPDVAGGDSSFGDILSQFEQAHHSSGETVEGNVVSVTPDAVFVDLGRKMDGVITPDGTHQYKVGDKVLVSIRGRDEEGNYQLSTIKVETPRDWSGLEAAFAAKKTIGGTVLEIVKGGLRVDVGARAFMPASRSGAREQADLEKLVGQQIECRIIKLDTEHRGRGGGPARGPRRNRKAGQARGLRAIGRRRGGPRHGPQPDRFRSIRRSGRRGWLAARLRHELPARREAGRRGDGRRVDRSQDPEDQSRHPEDRAGIEAAGGRSLVAGSPKNTKPARE